MAATEAPKGKIGIQFARVLGGSGTEATVIGTRDRSSVFGAAFCSQAKDGVSLAQLEKLLKDEAPRHWLSFPRPADLAKRLAHYEERTASLTVAETEAIDADLRKGDLSDWELGGTAPLESLKFPIETLPVGTTVHLDKVYQRKGYWLCNALGMSGVPILLIQTRLYPPSLNDIDQKYHERRKRGGTVFVLRDNKLSLGNPPILNRAPREPSRRTPLKMALFPAVNTLDQKGFGFASDAPRAQLQELSVLTFIELVENRVILGRAMSAKTIAIALPHKILVNGHLF